MRIIHQKMKDFFLGFDRNRMKERNRVRIFNCIHVKIMCVIKLEK